MLMQAAPILGCPPWELLDVPSVWIEWALLSRAAENEAREALAKSSK